MRNSLLTALVIAVVIGLGVGIFARSFVVGNPMAIAPTLEPATAVPTRVPASTATPPSAASSVRVSTPTPAPIATVAAAPANRNVVMEVSEADLDQEFASKLVGQSLGKTPLGDATVRSVAVQLRDKQVKLDGNANVGFLQAPFTVVGTVTPNAAGKPMVSVSQAMVGGVVLPDTARDALAESVQTQVDSMFGDRDVKVQSIDIADGKMRIVGTKSS